MSRITIRRFDVVRTANVVAVLYAVIVLVFLVPFVALVGIAGVASIGSDAGGAALGAGMVGALLLGVLGVVFYGAIGWVMTAIMCALYNFVAGRVGGIRVQVDLEGQYPGGPGSGVPAYPPAYGTPGSGTPPPPPGWGQPGG